MRTPVVAANTLLVIDAETLRFTGERVLLASHASSSSTSLLSPTESYAAMAAKKATSPASSGSPSAPTPNKPKTPLLGPMPTKLMASTSGPGLLADDLESTWTLEVKCTGDYALFANVLPSRNAKVQGTWQLVGNSFHTEHWCPLAQMISSRCWRRLR